MVGDFIFPIRDDSPTFSLTFSNKKNTLELATAMMDLNYNTKNRSTPYNYSYVQYSTQDNFVTEIA